MCWIIQKILPSYQVKRKMVANRKVLAPLVQALFKIVCEAPSADEVNLQLFRPLQNVFHVTLYSPSVISVLQIFIVYVAFYAELIKRSNFRTTRMKFSDRLKTIRLQSSLHRSVSCRLVVHAFFTKNVKLFGGWVEIQSAVLRAPSKELHTISFLCFNDRPLNTKDMEAKWFELCYFHGTTISKQGRKFKQKILG